MELRCVWVLGASGLESWIRVLGLGVLGSELQGSAQTRS